MSRDGLLPQWAAKVHPRFRTPYVSSIAVGIFVAVFAALVDISVLGRLVSIGTLLAFVIVCAGVLVLCYRHPELRRPFRTPGVPFVPDARHLVSLSMMISLPLDTWLRLLVWLAIGMVIYFGYSRKHSRVQQGQSGVPLVPPTEATSTWQGRATSLIRAAVDVPKPVGRSLSTRAGLTSGDVPATLGSNGPFAFLSVSGRGSAW